LFSLGRTDLTFRSDDTRMRPPALAASPPGAVRGGQTETFPLTRALAILPLDRSRVTVVCDGAQVASVRWLADVIL